jgi:capsular exopolysaccharide synthesis family protein
LISRWQAKQAKGQVQVQKENEHVDRYTSLVTVHDPSSAPAEAYRTLLANLLFAPVDAPPKVITITSPGPREGKSITCANLGVALARAGKTTLILDCDLHTPTIHELFGLDKLHGLTEILAETSELLEVLREPLPALNIVTAGAKLTSDPVQLLTSSRFAKVLHNVHQRFDYVLIDTPPLGSFSDAAIIATLSDGVVMVLDAQNTRRRSVRQSVQSLEAVGANILGTVINNVEV